MESAPYGVCAGEQCPPLQRPLRLLLRVGVGGNFHGFFLQGGFGAGLGGSDKPCHLAGRLLQ